MTNKNKKKQPKKSPTTFEEFYCDGNPECDQCYLEDYVEMVINNYDIDAGCEDCMIAGQISVNYSEDK